MGALIEVEGKGVAATAKSHAQKNCASSPVVYQLMRVGVDGSLVPATDDELMEVEHLLEHDGSQLQPSEDQAQAEREWLFPTTSNFEGLSECVTAEGDSKKLNTRLEDKMSALQCESGGHSPKDVVVGDKALDCLDRPESCDGNVKPEEASKENVASTTCLNGNSCSHIRGVETVTEPTDEAVAGGSSISETHTRSEPDFSILEREISLDNLTIRELQEVFRATFGRHTSVKDKLWLKRRIAMGLTNSCEVQTTNIVIKNNKIVRENSQSNTCTGQEVMLEVGFRPDNLLSDSSNENFADSPIKPIHQVTDEEAFAGKSRRPPVECGKKTEDVQMEHCANKRTRKPTKRYIEELSDVENREYSGRLISSPKVSGQVHRSPKCQTRTLRDIGCSGTSFVTREDSIGGCGMQVPYVSRTRRGRPRRDYYALANFGGMEEADNTETVTSYSEEEQDLYQEKVNLTGDSSSDNNDEPVRVDKVRSPKISVKRKHHRAWTLCEVLKLVEGVARYGAGRWSEIRRVAFASYSYRTSVDLKDKWRNLIKAASYVHDPADKGAKNFRRPASATIPTSILLRVRELAEMHAQTGTEYTPTKFAGHGGRIVVQEKGSGFL